jgi:hypothetical protein
MPAIMLGLARTNVFAVRVQCNYWKGGDQTYDDIQCVHAAVMYSSYSQQIMTPSDKTGIS